MSIVKGLQNVGTVSRSCIKMMSTSASSGRLAGKVAIVTASTDGIGLAIARRLAQDGAKVMVSSRKQKNVDKAVADLRKENLDVDGIVCHVAKAEDRVSLVKTTAEKFGGIDILISNAGTNPSFGPILDTSEEAWDKIFDTNVKAAFFLTKEAVPYIEKRGGGSVVFVSSVAGYAPFELLGAYSVSKTALVGLVKGVAPQLARMNIRANGLAPGIIKTGFSKALYTNPMLSDKMKDLMPIGRFGEPDDCAGAVSFLVSDDAKYVVGETMLVTGGYPARL